MYNKIYNPQTNNLININTTIGKQILENYLNFIQTSTIKNNYIGGGKSYGNKSNKENKSNNIENKFFYIYNKNIWGSSGTGSKFTPDNKWFLEELRKHLNKYNLKNIADLGCGDWAIMRNFNFKTTETYTGIDCVDFLINDLNKKHSGKNIKFIHQDISTTIPSGYDIIILKDVIQHWTDEYIETFFPKILANNKYVYCINGYKFTRDPSKNNWTKRELDKKYHFHPITIDKEPFKKFKNKVIDIKYRRSKEYILFKN